MKKAILLVIVVAVVLAFASLAEPIRSITWERSNHLLESGVTVRQFFQEVDPSMLAEIPSRFHDVQIKPASRSSLRVERQVEGDGLESILGIAISYTGSTAAKSDSRCYFGVSSTVTWPPFFRIPYMSVIGLLYGPGGLWGSCSDSGTNVWRVTENDTVSVQGGGSYSTTGIHVVELPAGYSPPMEVVYTQTPWIQVP